MIQKESKKSWEVLDKVLLLISILILPPNQIEIQQNLDENGTWEFISSYPSFYR